MPIVASGIGSGLDIAGLVSQLVAAEGEPATARLNAKEVNLGSELTAFGTLKSALSTLQSSITKLEDASAFQVFTSTSSDEGVFTASTDTTAVAGQYDIEVIEIAMAEKLSTKDYSSSTDIVGTGTLDISLGADAFQVTIDTSNSTLEGIRDAINDATDNPGVTASLITVDSGTQLIFNSNKVGASNTIGIVATDDDGSDGYNLRDIRTSKLNVLQVATDAEIEIDSLTVTRSSNSFSDVITGVTFNLLSEDSGSVKTLTIAADNDSIKKDIENFVLNYNTLNGVMKGLTKYNETTREAGALNGDSVVRGIQSKMRQVFSTVIDSGAFSSLSEMGITLNDSGSYEIDDAKLDATLAGDLGDVKSFFSATDGFAGILTSALSGYVDDDGIIDSRSDGLQTRLDTIDDKREALVRRMAAYEARLNIQFTAMDILVSQLQATGSYLTQQLDSLPTISNS